MKMKSPREVLLKACKDYCMDESIGKEDGILDNALSDLAEIVRSHKTRDGVGFLNVDYHNQAIEHIAKLFEAKD